MKKQTVAKKVLSLILGLVMVLGLAVPTLAGVTKEITSYYGDWDEGEYRYWVDEAPVASVTNVTNVTFGYGPNMEGNPSRYRLVYATAPAIVTILDRPWFFNGSVTVVEIWESVRPASVGAVAEYPEWLPGVLEWRPDFMDYFAPPGSTFVLGEGVYSITSEDGPGAWFRLIVSADGGAPTPEPTPQPPTPDEINVTINGQAVSFPGGQGPVIDGGRTLVPVRGVFEMLGFYVDWDGATETAILTSAAYEVRITIGSDIFTTNGIPHTLDVPAQNIGGRTMVPIRLPLESVGFNVGWDEATRTVLITSS